MVKVTWRQIVDEAFKDAVIALGNTTQMDAKQRYRAGKLCAAADQQMKYIREARKECIKPFVELDEKGEPRLDEKTKQNIWKGPTGQEDFKTAWEKLLTEKSIEVSIHKLAYDEVKKVDDLNGLMLLAIEPLLEGMPDPEAA